MDMIRMVLIEREVNVKKILSVMTVILLSGGCCGHAGASGRGKCAADSGGDVGRASVVVEGVRFDIVAKPVKSQAGLGVKVDVRVSPDDGMEHWLEENPLIFEGSYTRGKAKYGFTQGGPVVIPPNRVQVKPGSELKFSDVLPAGAKDQGVEKGESIEFMIRISGMITVDGSIVTPDVARVEMIVSEEGVAAISIQPAAGKVEP
jgi:hypothetical protein